MPSQPAFHAPMLWLAIAMAVGSSVCVGPAWAWWLGAILLVAVNP